MKKLVSVLVLSLSLSASLAFANAKQINVSLKGMVCSSCANEMKTKFQARGEVQAVKVDLRKAVVQLTLKDGQDLSDEQIKSIVGTKEDYSVTKIRRQ